MFDPQHDSGMRTFLNQSVVDPARNALNSVSLVFTPIVLKPA
jgi:hypothetical protein